MNIQIPFCKMSDKMQIPFCKLSGKMVGYEVVNQSSSNCGGIYYLF